MAFRILAFGDSLTEGWCNFGYTFHPYSSKLLALLKSTFTTKSFDIVIKGFSGKNTAQLNQRLPQVLADFETFDMVIILGGTNDLGQPWEKDGGLLFQRIKSLHEIALQSCSCTVAITLPETGYEIMEQYSYARKKRCEVNELLKKYASESGGRVLISDLAPCLPQHSLSKEDRSKFWNDGLHFSPEGYERMAEIIFEDIRPYFSS